MVTECASKLTQPSKKPSHSPPISHIIFFICGAKTGSL